MASTSKGASSYDKTTSSSTSDDDGFSSPRKHGSLDTDMIDGEKDCVDLTDETIDDGVEDSDSRTNCAIEKRSLAAAPTIGKDDNTAADIPVHCITENSPPKTRAKRKADAATTAFWDDVKRLKGIPEDRADLAQFTHVCRVLLPNGQPCNTCLKLNRTKNKNGTPGSWVNNKGIKHIKNHHPGHAAAVAKKERDTEAHDKKVGLCYQQPTKYATSPPYYYIDALNICLYVSKLPACRCSNMPHSSDTYITFFFAHDCYIQGRR